MSSEPRINLRGCRRAEFGPLLVAVVPRCQSRAPAWVQLWVHYGSNKRCVGLFPAL